MRLTKATEDDSERLKAFFTKMTLPGAIDFSIHRLGSFFDHYRLLSNDFETLLLIDEKDQIAGMATLLFREGLVNGEKQMWGYATDLRIAPTRKAIAQWAQLFLPVLERAIEERRCRYIFSTVEQHDNQAYNALIRPTSHARRRLPRYQLLNRFRVVGLHGRVPFAEKPLTSIRLKELELKDVEELCAYLMDRARLRPLAIPYTPETFMSGLEHWPGLSLSDFRIARDAKDKIIGCAALWNGRQVQSFVPQAYHGFARTLHQTMRLARLTGIIRPTADPGYAMPARFLDFLNCDSGEVFHRLTDEAFSRLGPREFLSYLHFRGNWRTLPPKAFFASALPFGLYLVLPPGVEAPPWPAPDLRSLPPEIEIAWL